MTVRTGYIRYDVLYAYVLSRMQYRSALAQQNEDELLKRLLNVSDKERSSARKRQENDLKKAEKRKAEVDFLFAKMYEDWSVGRITEYNFNMLSQKYQTEQWELDAKIEQLREASEAATQTVIDAEKWMLPMLNIHGNINIVQEVSTSFSTPSFSTVKLLRVK